MDFLTWMAEKGFATIDDFRGLSLPNVREWKQLNLNYQIVARIHEDLCIGCQLCYTLAGTVRISAFIWIEHRLRLTRHEHRRWLRPRRHAHFDYTHS